MDWISIEESGYPEDDVRVLVYDVRGVDGGQQIDIEYREGEFWHEGGVYSSITHWMPLPSPPKT